MRFVLDMSADKILDMLSARYCLSVQLTKGKGNDLGIQNAGGGFLRSLLYKFSFPPQDNYFDQSTSLVGSFNCKGIAGREASAVVSRQWFLAAVDCHIDTVHALEISHP